MSPHPLGPPPPVDAAHLDALRDRLGLRADADGLVDVAYAVDDGPLGPLLLAATGAGLVRVAFAVQGHDAALEELARAVGPRVVRAPARLDEARRQVDEYLAGRRTAFDLPLDRRLSRGFRGDVQRLLGDIPFGATWSYSRLAERAGSPRAVRAVGSACATNPLPVVVPCHRVLRADGSLGGYAGGPDAKRALLALEARG